jgi:hypothetical protein
MPRTCVMLSLSKHALVMLSLSKHRGAPSVLDTLGRRLRRDVLRQAQHDKIYSQSQLSTLDRTASSTW